MATPKIPAVRTRWATNPAGPGWISLFEFLLGSAIVIGHNVYHLVPNEVPILFVIGWISIRSARWRMARGWAEKTSIVAQHGSDRTRGGGAAPDWW